MFVHILPTQVMIQYVFQGSDGTLLERVENLKKLLHDLLLEVSASSVEVEKAHANLQQDVQIHRSNPKWPTTIQGNSYIMSAVLARQSLKTAIEASVLNKAKGKVNRLLRHRVVESADLAMNTGTQRNGISSSGHVKRNQKSMLKGMMSLK